MKKKQSHKVLRVEQVIGFIDDWLAIGDCHNWTKTPSEVIIEIIKGADENGIIEYHAANRILTSVETSKCVRTNGIGKIGEQMKQASWKPIVNPTVLLDCDDTCLVFTDIFDGWVRSNGFSPVGKLSDTYHIERWLGIDFDAAPIVDAFNHSEAMANQPPMECALDIIPRLYALGYRFVAITACGTDEAFRLQRWKTLERAFGVPWEDVRTVGYGESKKDLLASYPKSIWVEDNLKHAIVGAEIGHRTFLLDYPHNRSIEHPLVTRVTDWRDIMEHLEACQNHTDI